MSYRDRFYVLERENEGVPSRTDPLVGIGFLSSRETDSLLDPKAEHSRQDCFNEVLANYIIKAGDGELDRTYIVQEIRWGDDITSHLWDGKTEDGNALTTSQTLTDKALDEMISGSKKDFTEFLESCRKTTNLRITSDNMYNARHTDKATISHRLTQYYMPIRDEKGVVRFKSSCTPWIDVTVHHSSRTAQDKCLRPLCVGLADDSAVGRNEECVERADQVENGWIARAESEFRARLVDDIKDLTL